MILKLASESTLFNTRKMIDIENLTKELSFHIILLFVIGILTPIFTYFGLRRELKVLEQILAILTVFIMIEVIIYLLPFLVIGLKQTFS